MTTYLTRFAILTAVAHLTIELCANFLPVVYPTLINTLGLSYAQIGLIALVAAGCSSLAQPLFGYLSDHWDPNRLAVFSVAWIGVLMSLVGFTKNYDSLLVLVGIGTLGSAAFHPAGAVLAATNAGKRRGAAISVFSVGGNLGAALSPLWVAAGISWLGLAGTIVILPVALFVTLLLYQHLGTRPKLVAPQSEMTKSKTQASPKEGSIVAGLALLTLVVMCRSWFQVSLMTYLPEWIQSQGQSLAFGGQVLAVFMISISVGSLTGGPLSDHIGRWQVVALSLTFLGLAQWFFVHAPLFWQVGLAAVMGLMVGASFPVAIVMAQETWPRGVGMASSLVLGFGWAPGGLGAWLTGLIADQSSLANGLQGLVWPPLLGVVCMLIYARLQLKHQVR